jgi:alpha-beta hydrolase superfamily lysophospholipase
MSPATRRILKITALILIAMPLLSALAGLLLGPTVLHPFRHRLTVRQIAQADQIFESMNATREDFIVPATDGILLGGWKIRPAHPNGDWVLLLHGRSHNRSVMLPYTEFLLPAGYSVVMMDARAHGNSGGSISTYGQIEIFDMRAIVKNLEDTEKVGHLFAIGESMGAAVSLQSAAFVPQIEGVVAEASFRNLREVTFDYAGLQQSAILGKTLFRPAAVVAVWIAQTQGAGSDSRISLRKRRLPFAHFQYSSSAARATAKSRAGTPQRSSIQQSARKNCGMCPPPATSKPSKLRQPNFNAAFSIFSTP